MSRQTLGLGKRLQDFVVRYGACEPYIPARLHDEAVELPLGGMQVSSDQCMFLMIFVKPIGARTMFGIGLFNN